MGRIWSNGSGLPINAANLNGMEGDITRSVKPWAASTGYTAGQAALDPDFNLVTANATHTSGASFTAGNWTYRATRNVAKAFGWAIVTDTQWAGGADPTGAADSAAAINAAINGAQTVYLPAGTYLISSTQVQPIAGTRLIGAGQRDTTLKAAAGLATAVILGTSGAAAANVELRDFGIDGNSSGGTTLGACVQMTNAPEFSGRNLYIHNSYGAGINLQGFGGAGNGCPRSVVEGCRLDSIGLANASTGHGIIISGQSDHTRITGNTLTNIVGGMGISGVSNTNGSPDHSTFSQNTITMAASTTGFEGIGLDAGTTYAAVVGNTVTNSQDNGISTTGGHCTVVGNTIDGAVNHGIWASSYSTVTGNTIRNCGQDYATSGALYGGVALNASTGATVTGNTILDDQGAHTMGYLVKMTGTSGGGNIIGPNAGSGWNQSSPYNGFNGSTDIVFDTHSNTTGLTIPKILAPGTNSLQLGSSTQAVSQFWVGNTAQTVAAQFAARTNSTTRVTAAIQAVASQTSDLFQIQDSSGAVMVKVGVYGSIKANAFATASRPSASTVGAGAQIYDTTLSKPVWSDGTTWRDAAGTAV